MLWCKTKLWLHKWQFCCQVCLNFALQSSVAKPSKYDVWIMLLQYLFLLSQHSLVLMSFKVEHGFEKFEQHKYFWNSPFLSWDSSHLILFSVVYNIICVWFQIARLSFVCNLISCILVNVRRRLQSRVIPIQFLFGTKKLQCFTCKFFKKSTCLTCSNPVSYYVLEQEIVIICVIDRVVHEDKEGSWRTFWSILILYFLFLLCFWFSIFHLLPDKNLKNIYL